MNVNYCPECGAKPVALAKFCPQCGYNLGSLTPSAVPSTSPATAQVESGAVLEHGDRSQRASESLKISPANKASTNSQSVSIRPAAVVLPRPNSSEGTTQIRSDGPQTLLVSQQGDGAFTTITEALKNARPGASIRVRKGIYVENLFIRRPVTLEAEAGSKRDQVIVASDTYAALCVKSDDVVVRGMSFMTSRPTPGVRPPEMEIEYRDNVDYPGSGPTSENAERNHLYSYNLDTFVPAVAVAIYRGTNILLEDCVVECRPAASGNPQNHNANYALQGISDTFNNISTSPRSTIRLVLRGCIVRGGDAGINLGYWSQQPWSDDSSTIVENCEVHAFSKYGISGANHPILITKCKIHSFVNSPNGTPDLNEAGIALRQSPYVVTPDRTVRVTAVIDDCDVHNCGAIGIHGEYTCEMGRNLGHRCDPSFRVIVRGCRISRATRCGINCRGGILELYDCVIYNNGTRTKEQPFSEAVGIQKEGTTLMMTNCRITTSRYAVRVPQVDNIYSQQFDDLSFVEIVATNCDLLGNDLGSWHLPPCASLKLNGVRAHDNKGVKATIVKWIHNR